MPQDIFGDVTRPPKALGSQAWYTVPLSIVVHALAVAVVVIVPLMATDVIPTPTSALTAIVAPPPRPDPPPEPQRVQRAAPQRTSTEHAPQPGRSGPAAPANPGDKILEELPGPPVPPGHVHTGPPSDPIGNSPPGDGTIVIPGPPAAVTGPIRPGGVVKYPAKVRDVRPVYPRLAADSKGEGRVIIEAII